MNAYREGWFLRTGRGTSLCPFLHLRSVAHPYTGMNTQHPEFRLTSNIPAIHFPGRFGDLDLQRDKLRFVISLNSATPPDVNFTTGLMEPGLNREMFPIDQPLFDDNASMLIDPRPNDDTNFGRPLC